MTLLSIESVPVGLFLLYISCARVVVHVNNLRNEELYNLSHLNYRQMKQGNIVYIRQKSP